MDIEATYGRDSQSTAAAVVQRLKSPKLLVIDDVHELMERGDHIWPSLRLTLDIRYREQKPTLLMGNWHEDDLVRVAGAAIADRCNERGGVVDFAWGSFRQEQGGAEASG